MNETSDQRGLFPIRVHDPQGVVARTPRLPARAGTTEGAVAGAIPIEATKTRQERGEAPTWPPNGIREFNDLVAEVLFRIPDRLVKLSRGR